MTEIFHCTKGILPLSIFHKGVNSMQRHFSGYTAVLLCGMLIGTQSCKKDDSVANPIDYSQITAIHYTEHVQPILQRSCAYSNCHDAATRAAGLQLPFWDNLIKGSLYGEVVVPYKPSRSLMVTLFDGTQMRRSHPSLGTYSLSGDEIDFLKRWIREGAKNSSGIIPYQLSSRKLYVPNQGEDAVAIIDIDSLVVARYIDVGRYSIVEGPHYIEANEDFWYVSLISTGEVWKFDAHVDTLVAVAQIQGSPALLQLTPDGSKLYVSQFSTSSTNYLTVVNTATMTVARTVPVWRMPHGLRINHAGTRVYAANMMSDNVSVIDVATDSVMETIPIAFDANPFGPVKYMPMEIAISPNDSVMMVTCSERREVRMFDLMSYTLIDSFTVGDQPWHLQFTPDGEFCYVTNRRSHSVSVIHVPMRHVMETVTTTSPPYFDYPHGCDISINGRYIFVANENVGHMFIPRYSTDYVGNVCVIDQTLNQIIKVLEVGKVPTGLSVNR
jgi:YVTN family beta-propeller protein